MPIAGGSPTVIVPSGHGAGDFALDGATIYFIGWNGAGLVSKVRAAGGAATTLVDNLDGTSTIATHATSIYWTVYGPCTPWSDGTDRCDGRIMQMAKP